ncbi:MAG TPA: hypothetical protein VFQ12_04240 [Thermoleophilaceae bacterium]|nr:hypothetical protein [Thermoleophilaceae bacterium]
MTAAGTEPTGRRRELRALGLELWELAVFAAFALVGSLPLLILVWDVVANDKLWVGTDGGPVIQDQMQYVNWIRNASESVLISNHYEAGATEASYLHPGALISGGLVALGLSPEVGYLLWKPFAIIALFAAVALYVRRLVPPGLGRLAALVLALFFLPPTTLIVTDEIGLTVAAGEVWPLDMLWGYFFSALAVAGLVAALLLYERDRRNARPTPWPPLLAFLSAWLQPWEGPLLLGIVVGAELLLWLIRRRGGAGVEPAPENRTLARLLGPLVGAVAIPLGYYVVLGRVDPAWSIDPGVHDFLDPPWWAIGVTIAPLALPGLLAYRLRPTSFHQAALRVWPIAALGLYWVLTTAYPGHYAPHALRGLSIPLAVLAVLGIASLRVMVPRTVALAAVACALAVLTLPATVDRLGEARDRINENSGPYFLTRGERDALDYLDRLDTPGAVYAPVSMGQLVPAKTGRHTSVGNLFWTPDYLRRRAYTQLLFQGFLAPPAVRAIARSSGARFMFTGCTGATDLEDALRPLLASVRRFDCATVYELRG